SPPAPASARRVHHVARVRGWPIPQHPLTATAAAEQEGERADAADRHPLSHTRRCVLRERAVLGACGKRRRDPTCDGPGQTRWVCADGGVTDKGIELSVLPPLFTRVRST